MTKSTPARYTIKRSRETPSGDFGNVLVHGIIEAVDPKDGAISLARTGPYVPAVTTASRMVIVTEAVRALLEQNHISGMGFARVEKVHIAHVDWQEWDRAEFPEYFPENGEPEGYVLLKEHDQALADAMPVLWRLTSDSADAAKDVSFVKVGQMLPQTLFSERAARLLEMASDGFVEFEPSTMHG